MDFAKKVYNQELEVSSKLIRSVLDSKSYDLIKDLGRIAKEQNFDLYLVGGVVRDILLRRKCEDLDFVFDGNIQDIVELLPRVDSEYHFENKAYFKKYHTAKFKASFYEQPESLLEFDIAGFRKESYPKSGANPVVEVGNMSDDVRRRDFTANSLLFNVKDIAGRYSILDISGGFEDIDEGVLRVFHDLSFVDDPARLIRALRFIGRLGFRFDAHTKKLFDKAVEKKLLLTLPGYRLFDEFSKGFNEEEGVGFLKILLQYKLVDQVFSEILGRTFEGRSLESFYSNYSSYDEEKSIINSNLIWEGVFSECTKEEVLKLAAYFELSKSDLMQFYPADKI